MHNGRKRKKRSTSPTNMILRPLSAEQAAVAQHLSGAVAMHTLLSRRCYKGKRLVTSSSAVPSSSFLWPISWRNVHSPHWFQRDKLNDAGTLRENETVPTEGAIEVVVQPLFICVPETKVDEDGSSCVHLQQDVLWLQIAVDNSFTMAVDNSLNDLPEKKLRCFLIETIKVLQVLEKVLRRFRPLHDDHGVPPTLSEI